MEAWSKTWKLSVEHKARQCGESFRCLKMWEALSLTKCSLTRVKNAGRFHRRNRHCSQHIQTYKPHVNGARQGQGLSHQKVTDFEEREKQFDIQVINWRKMLISTTGCMKTSTPKAPNQQEFTAFLKCIRIVKLTLHRHFAPSYLL